MRFLYVLLTSVALLVPVHAASTTGDTPSPTPVMRLEAPDETKPHAELRAMSSPTVTLCYREAIMPLLTAIAFNRNALIAEALRTMRATGGCAPSRTHPRHLAPTILYWGTLLDGEGGAVSYTVYRAIVTRRVLFQGSAVTMMVFEQRFYVCWRSPKRVRGCF